MLEIITKHKNGYKVFHVLPMYNVHPYFPPNIWAKSAHYTQRNAVDGKACHVLKWKTEYANL